jgi:hypothetical protein
VSDLGPETFEDDLRAGRAQFRLPGGARVDIEKMIGVVVASGDEHPIRLFLHPQFEGDAIAVFRELAAELNAWADRKERDGVVTDELPRPGRSLP